MIDKHISTDRRPTRRWSRRIIGVIGLIVIAVLVIAIVRTLTLGSRQIQTAAPSPGIAIEVSPEQLARQLSQAVQIRTISREGAPVAADAFAALYDLLRQQFPRFHQELEREVIADYSLLYTWRGTDPALKPALLLAHTDVVPVDASALERWQHEPFSGDIADGFIWGRGTLDDKMSVLGLMAAAEALLAQGFRPQRTLYFAFGHDEEIGGDGARAIAAHLEARNIRMELVLDEGMLITEGVLAGMEPPFALIGVAEKGALTLELKARSTDGHSSMPPRDAAISLLASAIHRLRQSPLPADVDGILADMLGYAGPHMPFAQRLAIANLWLTAPVMETALAASPSTNALLRTTTAPTIFAAGTKQNVLPKEARAVLNFRIKPGDTIASVTEHVRRAIADDRVEIKQLDGWEASPVTATDAPGFVLVQQTIAQVFPEAIVAPGLVVGATDARHYASLSDATLRFVPVRANTADIARIHGIDERISVDNFAEIVRFYAALMQNLNPHE